jgi:hypothetical protein
VLQRLQRADEKYLAVGEIALWEIACNKSSILAMLTISHRK